MQEASAAPVFTVKLQRVITGVSVMCVIRGGVTVDTRTKCIRMTIIYNLLCVRGLCQGAEGAKCLFKPS